MPSARTLALALALAVAAGGCGGDDPAAVSLAEGGKRWAETRKTLPNTLDRRSANPCGRGSSDCIDIVVGEMQRRLARLAAACDHNAPFSLMYLRVTEGVARTGLERFRDPGYLNHLDAVFAGQYFRAFDRWRAGRRDEVPEAWRIALEAADEREVTGLGDMLLGMNAHISRDLPFGLARVGLKTPEGRSGREDFDRVNELLGDVKQDMLREQARRFDPTIATSTLPAVGTAASIIGEVIARWRTDAWLDAERLLAARTRAERSRVVDSIERGAAGRARLIASVTSNLVTGPAADERDNYCESRRL